MGRIVAEGAVMASLKPCLNRSSLGKMCVAMVASRHVRAVLAKKSIALVTLLNSSTTIIAAIPQMTSFATIRRNVNMKCTVFANGLTTIIANADHSAKLTLCHLTCNNKSFPHIHRILKAFHSDHTKFPCSGDNLGQ